MATGTRLDERSRRALERARVAFLLLFAASLDASRWRLCFVCVRTQLCELTKALPL